MAGSIAGAFFSGEKPQVPRFIPVSTEQEQQASITQNLEALPRLQELAGQINTFQADQMMKQLEKIFPGYSNLLKQGTETIQSQLRGELPEDLQRSIAQATAEQARAGGYAGSQAAGNLTARDLGLTSLQLTNQALGTAERWMARAEARTPLYDYTSMFVTPQQRIDLKFRENQLQFQREWMANQIKALPEPWETAVKNFFDNIEETGQSALGAYAGGAMGGGGGMAGAGAGASGGAYGYGDMSYGQLVSANRYGYGGYGGGGGGYNPMF